MKKEQEGNEEKRMQETSFSFPPFSWGTQLMSFTGPPFLQSFFWWPPPLPFPFAPLPGGAVWPWRVGAGSCKGPADIDMDGWGYSDGIWYFPGDPYIPDYHCYGNLWTGPPEKLPCGQSFTVLYREEKNVGTKGYKRSDIVKKGNFDSVIGKILTAANKNALAQLKKNDPCPTRCPAVGVVVGHHVRYFKGTIVVYVFIYATCFIKED